jgi:hypothetical protein
MTRTFPLFVLLPAGQLTNVRIPDLYPNFGSALAPGIRIAPLNLGTRSVYIRGLW